MTDIGIGMRALGRLSSAPSIKASLGFNMTSTLYSKVWRAVNTGAKQSLGQRPRRRGTALVMVPAPRLCPSPFGPLGHELQTVCRTCKDHNGTDQKGTA